MNPEAVKRVVYEVAQDYARRGPGWAQQAVVLREATERLSPELGKGLEAQQAILTAWHDLFLDRQLSWGYNLDNPNEPFYHLRQPTSSLAD